MSRAWIYFFPFLLAASLTLSACGDSNPGALEQAGFRVGCQGDDDACPVSDLDAPLAVGATEHLEIDLLIPGSFCPTAPFLSLAPGVIEAQGFDLQAKSEGTCAILLMTSDGQVLDFIHLWAVRPDRMQLHLLSAEGLDMGRIERDLQMVAGESMRFKPVAHQGNLALLGHFDDSQWRIEGNAVQLLDEGLGHHRRLRAVQTGTAVLHVEASGMLASLNVEVLP